MLYIFVILLSSLGFLVSSCRSQDISGVVNANNQFACELYSQYKSGKGNVFFSPYSISSALAIVYEGAKGKTAEQIQSVFHFPKDGIARRESFLEIYNRINKKDKEYQLHTANALWAQKDSPFLKDYFALTEKYYAGRVTNLDFKREAEKSCLIINRWVEEQTNNKIKNLIPQDALGEMTRMVITNAIYFKGLWAKQFDKKDTTESEFRVSPADKVKVQMMRLTDREAEFNYAEAESLQILELSYKGGELSMLILLPKEGSMSSLEESLNVRKISALRESLKKENVEVYLPKFKFEAKYFIAENLREMGMPAAFSEEADFSGMTGKRDLFISDVIHQAFVEVNEEGTQAAAATSVMCGITAIQEDIKIFNADHPFIFIIQQRDTGNILFLGRVNNPNL